MQLEGFLGRKNDGVFTEPGFRIPRAFLWVACRSAWWSKGSNLQDDYMVTWCSVSLVGWLVLQAQLSLAR